MNDSIQIASAFVSPLLRPLFEQVDPRVLGGYRRALEVMERYGERLLRAANYDPGLAREIVHQLVYDYPSHGSVIHVDEAAEMGLRARPAADETTEQLMESVLDEAPDQGYIGFVQRPVVAKKKAKPKKMPVEASAIETEATPATRTSRRKQNGKTTTALS